MVVLIWFSLQSVIITAPMISRSIGCFSSKQLFISANCAMLVSEVSAVRLEHDYLKVDKYPVDFAVSLP